MNCIIREENKEAFYNRKKAIVQEGGLDSGSGARVLYIAMTLRRNLTPCAGESGIEDWLADLCMVW